MQYGSEQNDQTLDYFTNKTNLELSGPLMATVVLYLSDSSQGGQILFPESVVRPLEFLSYVLFTFHLFLNLCLHHLIMSNYSQPRSSSWSSCSNSNKTIQPVKGNAILFFSLHPSASPDKSSFHSRCPVLEGDMWSAIKYFYAKPISRGKVSAISEEDECTDQDDSCPAWAAMGECQRNPVFMIGSPDYYGTCRKSCNAC